MLDHDQDQSFNIYCSEGDGSIYAVFVKHQMELSKETAATVQQCIIHDMIASPRI